MFPVIDKERTGKRLSHLMKTNGVTPKDIQDYLSLSCVQTVYRWMKGINVPSIDNLYALSQMFQVSVDEMLIGNRRLPADSNSVNGKERLTAYYLKWKEICAA